jgi:hypothetical protein
MGILDIQAPDFDKLAVNPLFQMGLGILANSSRPRGSSPFSAVGNGAMQGMQNVQQAQQAQHMQQMRQMQMDEVKRRQLQQAQQAEYIKTLPPEQQQAMMLGLPFEKIWERQNPIPKDPQLVEVADPADPLRTVKKWMRPGETDGVVAGQGKLPEILDPRVQGAKKAIAAAGAANQVVKLPPMETEENKAVGKALGESYTNIVNSGLQAPSKIKQLERMEQLLDGVEGGKLAPLGMDIASAAQSMGLKFDPKLGNKEAAQALSIEIASSFRQPGTGPMTDKDFENFLKRVPDLSKTAEGRKQITMTMKSALQRDVQVSKMARDYRKQNGTLNGFDEELAQFYASNPVVPDMGGKNGGFKIIGVR